MRHLVCSRKNRIVPQTFVAGLELATINVVWDNQSLNGFEH